MEAALQDRQRPWMASVERTWLRPGKAPVALYPAERAQGLGNHLFPSPLSMLSS